MNWQSLNGIILAITLVPSSVLFSIFMIIWFSCEKSEDWILMTMRHIITRKNIDLELKHNTKKNIKKELKYLFCNRILPDGARYLFVFGSIAIVITCVHCTFIIAMIEQTYNCRHDSDLYCFKQSFDFSQSAINNCSALWKDELVICYRITAFDLERALIGASAGYLLFKILTICLLIVAHIMLWLAQKLSKKTLQCYKWVFGLILFAVLNIIFKIQQGSTLRNVSTTVLIQIELVVINVFYFVAFLPWEIFRNADEYYGDASIPSVMQSLSHQSRSSCTYGTM